MKEGEERKKRKRRKKLGNGGSDVCEGQRRSSDGLIMLMLMYCGMF
jgi:hypothetical protein